MEVRALSELLSEPNLGYGVKLDCANIFGIKRG
jgi:hypothetical protein